METYIKFIIYILVTIALAVGYVELKDRWNKKHNKRNPYEDWIPKK